MVTCKQLWGVENEGSNPKSALIGYMTLRKSLKVFPVQEDNDATYEVNVRARLSNGANHFTHVKHARSGCRTKKASFGLGGHHLITYRERWSKVIIIPLKWITMVLTYGVARAVPRWIAIVSFLYSRAQVCNMK